MAMDEVFATSVLLLTTILTVDFARAQVLTPPYFNLAVSGEITATSTCGAGVSEPELFCKLTGANPDQPFNGVLGGGNFSVIQGQLCNYCDPRSRDQSHPAGQAIDGTERWWQSPPLSRGLEFNKVNLTIDLGQVSTQYTTLFNFSKLDI